MRWLPALVPLLIGLASLHQAQNVIVPSTLSAAQDYGAMPPLTRSADHRPQAATSTDAAYSIVITAVEPADGDPAADMVTVRGTVSLAGTGVITTVTVSVTRPSGYTQALPPVSSDAAGNWLITNVWVAPGSNRFVASSGNVTSAPYTYFSAQNPPPPQPTTLRFGYGMATASVSDSSLQAVRDAGFNYVLYLLSWRDAEPIKGTFDWRAADDGLNRILNHGLRPIIRIYKQPLWSRTDAFAGHAPPDDPHDLGRFVAAVVARYGTNAAGYQILNEPNLSVEWGNRQPEPRRYADLLTAAYTHAKRVNPAVTIISAGLATTAEPPGSPYGLDDRLFLQEFYAAGGAAYFDVLGANPYGFRYSPDDTSDANGFNFSRAQTLRNIMVANGDAAKQVWGLECGWLLTSTYPMGGYEWMKVTPEEQATYLTRAFQKAYWEWPWMGMLLVWNLDHSLYYPPQSEAHWFSLLNADGSPRQAYLALQAMSKPPPYWVPTPTPSPSPTATPTPIATVTATIPLMAGWNLIALPLRPVHDYTAEGVLQEITAQGGDALTIARWHAGGWSVHPRGMPFNDFPVEIGHGYFIRATRPSNWVITGFPIAGPLTITITAGWTLLGIPYPAITTARDLLLTIDAQGGNALEVARWYAGGWSSHLKDIPVNNFPLEAYRGYFLRASRPSTLILP